MTTFLDLPPELKLYIFQYLKTLDLLSLSQAYEQLSSLIMDVNNFKAVDLSNDYRLEANHLKIIFQPIIAQHVRVLNISKTNIPLKNMFVILQKLNNLERLNCVSSNIYAGDLMHILNRLPKLKHLAISGTDLVFSEALSCRLESLVINNRETRVKTEIFNLMDFQNLKVFEISTVHLDCEYIKEMFITCTKLDKITIYFILAGEFPDCLRNHSFTLMKGKVFNRIEVYRNSDASTIFRVTNLFSGNFFTIRYLKTRATWDNIDILELTPSTGVDIGKYQETIRSIFSTKVMKTVRKLSIAQPQYLKSSKAELDEIAFKKPRLSRTYEEAQDMHDCTLDLIPWSCPNLNELHIINCEWPNSKHYTKNGNCAKRLFKFNNLRVLLLSDVLLQDGPWIIEYLQSCHLESLGIICTTLNQSFWDKFLTGLSHMKRLNSFTLEVKLPFSVPRLFEALSGCSSLKQLYIGAPVGTLDLAVVQNFLHKVHIQVFHLLTTNGTKKSCRQTRKQIMHCFAKKPLRVTISSFSCSKGCLQSFGFPLLPKYIEFL